MTRAHLLIVAGIVSLQMGCGPSLRRTYQSDNAFESCFSADYEPAVEAADKDACWRSWLREHVYNQPPDKISYANLRLEELRQGIAVPGPPGPPGRFNERPKLPEGAPEASPSVTASDSCRAACRSTLRSCESMCDSAGGGTQKCLDACAAGAAACRESCGDDAEVEGQGSKNN